MADKINKELMSKLQEALCPFPEAIEFALAYRNLIHAIDDLVDDPNRPTSEALLKVFAQASAVYSLPFWKVNCDKLLIIEQLINNTYADSVLWENDAVVEHKRVASDTLRHTGLDMFFAIILITLGRDKLREFSAPFRQQCIELQSTN